jgi:hypothetical protein
MLRYEKESKYFLFKFPLLHVLYELDIVTIQYWNIHNAMNVAINYTSRKIVRFIFLYLFLLNVIFSVIRIRKNA